MEQQIEVTGEWNGRRYPAVVDRTYNVAVIGAGVEPVGKDHDHEHDLIAWGTDGGATG